MDEIEAGTVLKPSTIVVDAVQHTLDKEILKTTTERNLLYGVAI